MGFSRCVLAGVAAAQRELFVAPVQPELAQLTGLEQAVNPAVYGSAVAAPMAYADFEGAYGAEYVTVEQSSADFVVPALVVAGLALAGYSLGRASAQSQEFAPVEEYDPSALELAGAMPADVAMLGLQGRESRRELLAKAGAAIASMAAVQSASAKAGQFTKQEIFSVVGTPGISAPFQPGGPKPGQIGDKVTATYGYSVSEGEVLANGYYKDVTREKAAYEVSAKIVRSQQKNIDSKTWWLVRDNLRGQAYNMKANMLAINKVLEPAAQPKAAKAYKDFWNEINQLDLACVKKELDLAQKEYGDVLDALKKYEEIIA